MTAGTFVMIGIALVAWLLARQIDKTEQARDRIGVQLVAFFVGMLGAAAPIVLVMGGLVERTTLNEVVAAGAFIALCLRRDRLIWRKREGTEVS